MRKLTKQLLTVKAALFAPLLLAGCAQVTDGRFCSQAGCDFSEWEWNELSTLAELPSRPPDDPSNRYVGKVEAEALGHQFFYDGRFSGPSTQLDALRRPASHGRAPKGQHADVSCATCHDHRRVGTDPASVPGNVSVGSGWSDTNSPPTFNAAFYGITYWSGRADSLWAQAVNSNEGNNMNGSRLKTAWLIQDHYRDRYQTAFPDHPLPLTGKSADVQALVETTAPRAGQCKLTPGCPTESGCREVVENGITSCWPRFPLEGRPGTKPGCQAGDKDEPAGDAFDCMAPEDRDAVTRILVNWAKSIAAYEFRLVSRDSAFDRYVREVREVGVSHELTPAQKRGARLFVGKAACSDCHSGPLLSDSQFHNVGVPQIGPGVPTEADCPDGSTVCDCVENPTGSKDPMAGVRNCFPWGARDGLARLRRHEFRRDSAWSDNRADTSRKKYLDMSPGSVAKGAWRTPTLRDVARTAPYMHNGSLRTLEEVVWHYNVGGAPEAVGTRDARIKPLFLTAEEQRDLVEFLKSLTGQPLPLELAGPTPLPGL